MLSIYSTLTREQRPFESLEPGRVRMYVCGVTVYDYCHIGHGRTFVAFDVVRRWLEASGYKVTFVRNITDVDDKIIRRAAERGVTTDELTGPCHAGRHAGTGLPCADIRAACDSVHPADA